MGISSSMVRSSKRGCCKICVVVLLAALVLAEEEGEDDSGGVSSSTTRGGCRCCCCGVDGVVAAAAMVALPIPATTAAPCWCGCCCCCCVIIGTDEASLSVPLSREGIERSCGRPSLRPGVLLNVDRACSCSCSLQYLPRVAGDDETNTRGEGITNDRVGKIMPKCKIENRKTIEAFFYPFRQIQSSSDLRVS